MSYLLEHDTPKLWQLLEEPSLDASVVRGAFASLPPSEQLGFTIESYSELSAYILWLGEQSPLADHACFAAWDQLEARDKALFSSEQLSLAVLVERYDLCDLDAPWAASS